MYVWDFAIEGSHTKPQEKTQEVGFCPRSRAFLEEIEKHELEPADSGSHGRG